MKLLENLRGLLNNKNVQIGLGAVGLALVAYLIYAWISSSSEKMTDLQLVTDEEFQEASELMRDHETSDGYDYESEHDHNLAVACPEGELRGMYDVSTMTGA